MNRADLDRNALENDRLLFAERDIQTYRNEARIAELKSATLARPIIRYDIERRDRAGEVDPYAVDVLAITLSRKEILQVTLYVERLTDIGIRSLIPGNLTGRWLAARSSWDD